MHIVENFYYKPVAECFTQTCLCGEEEKIHKVSRYRACGDCDEIFVDNGYRLHVDWGKLEGTVTHIIGQCPNCGGLDMANYGSAEEMLFQFRNGYKESTVYH